MENMLEMIGKSVSDLYWVIYSNLEREDRWKEIKLLYTE
jgi:hypothetical protein